MPQKSILVLLGLLAAGLRRAALMLTLALVLSALEVERSGPPRRPAAVVVVLTEVPGPRRRARPHRRWAAGRRF